MPTHTYVWGNHPGRKVLKGQRCKLLVSGKMGSVLVRFESGEIHVVSRRALRRIV